MRSSVRLSSLSFSPWSIELSEPFGIATGAQALASNVLVRATLDDGSEGLGEAAPFPAVNGETQADALRTLEKAKSQLQGQAFSASPETGVSFDSHDHQALLSSSPSALCALETALVDASCRRRAQSLWQFFGASEKSLVTDITIVTGSKESAAVSARAAHTKGFRTLKVKVAGRPVADDVERLQAILGAAPHAELVLDANAAFSAEQAIELVQGLGALRQRIALFEQPTPRTDLAALGRVQETLGIPVAADESAQSTLDVERIAQQGVAQVINVKITKSGLSESLLMIRTAKACGLGLMVGGMVESKLCMTTSACMAAGLGGFAFVDLDTPFFMRGTGLSGGYRVDGARLFVDDLGAGHGVQLSSESALD